MRRHSLRHPIAFDAAEVMAEEAERFLDRAAALEDERLRLIALSAELENEGLEWVAQYEEQRRVVMSAQARLHGAEIAGTAADTDLDHLRSAFEAEEARKQDFWREAERVWAQSRRCLERSETLADHAAHLRHTARQFLEHAELMHLPAQDDEAA